MGLLGELLRSALHPAELRAMLQVKYGGEQLTRSLHKEPLDELAKTLSDEDFCYASLNKVSRSFAVVIQQLPENLTNAVCIFYLVLRGLDSVEDDMSYAVDDRVKLLRVFYEKLEDPKWSITGVGDAEDYRILLANFGKVSRVYLGLKKEFRNVISDITRRMGNGMADFAEKKGCKTHAEYELYCHYVAGLVGHGLSSLFSESGHEDPSLAKELELSNSMGLFLQKTNIIRDYAEDIDTGRTWWPEDIWSQYADQLGWFRHHPDDPKSLALLNHLVTDALRHVPDTLRYMEKLKDPQVFKFCALPQVMAIATLEAVYNNPNVFRENVKIRKGLACQLMLQTKTMAEVHNCFYRFASLIAARVPPNDPHARETLELTTKIRGMVQTPIPRTLLTTASVVAWVVLIAVSVFLLSKYRGGMHGGVGVLGGETALFAGLSASDLAAAIAAFCSVGYLLGFSGMHYV